MNLGYRPCLEVNGEPVTVEQAEEICIRTNSWYLTTVDIEFRKSVYELAGISCDDYGMPDGRDVQEFLQRINFVPLTYLTNHQICSTSPVGCFGWANWNGQIGTKAYELIGTPTPLDLETELHRIASAFPYLNANFKVSNRDNSSEFHAWKTHKGRVTKHRKGSQIEGIGESWESGVLKRFALGVVGEHGITLERLESILVRMGVI